MTLKEAFEAVYDVLQTMKTGEIRLFVKKGEITHVNRTEEVFPKRRVSENHGKINANEK